MVDHGIGNSEADPAVTAGRITGNTVSLPSGADDQGASAFADEPAWARLSAADTDQAFDAAWLSVQRSLTPETRAGLVMRVVGGALVPSAPAVPDAALFQVAERALAERRGVARVGAGDEPSLIAYPVLVAETVVAVAALSLAPSVAPHHSLRQALRRLQWGSATLRARALEARMASAEMRDRLAQTALRLLAVALDTPGFAPACRAVATELALSFGCERVSIGFRRGRHARVAAISHAARFGRQMNLVRQLGEAMDEAVDQRAIVAFPPPQNDVMVCRAQEQLARGHGALAVLTVPVFLYDAFIGAFTFEWAVVLRQVFVRRTGRT